MSPMYMGCPSSHASNFFRIKGAAHSRATRRRKLTGRRAHSSHIFPFISGSSFSTRAFAANISALLLQPPASSCQLCSSQRPTPYVIYIFITAFKMQEKKKEWGMNKASSCWGLKTFFLEHEASPTSSPQPAASLSTAPSVPHGHSSAGGQDASTQASSLNPLT